MKNFYRQYDFFNNNDLGFSEKDPHKDIFIDKKVIKEWQEKIITYQSPIFKTGHKNVNQSSLFE